MYPSSCREVPRNGRYDQEFEPGVCEAGAPASLFSLADPRDRMESRSHIRSCSYRGLSGRGLARGIIAVYGLVGHNVAAFS